MANKPSQYYPGFPPNMDPQLRKQLQHVWDRLNYLIEQVDAANGDQDKVVALGTQVGRIRVAIQAVQDSLTQGQAYVGFDNNTATPPDITSVTLSAAGDGFTITGTTSAGVINVSNAATARTALVAAQKQSPGAYTMTIPPVAPLTVPGSITWNAEGVITAYVAPS